MTPRIVTLFVVSLLAIALSGCANSINRSADISPANPIPTLMVTTFVDIATADKIEMNGLSDLKNIANLAKAAPDVFADQVVTSMMSAYSDYQNRPGEDSFDSGFAKPINEFLGSEGYQIVLDPDRARRADAIIPGYGMKQGKSWTHPAGATEHFNNRAFAGGLYKELGAGLGAGGREAFATIYVLVTKEDAFFGEIPIVSIDIEVIDQSGEKVFTAQGRGEGEKARKVDLSPANLRLALDAAFAAMRES